METITLEVKSRSADTSAKDVRNKGFIPANFYGPRQKNRNLEVDYQTFRKVFDKAGKNTVVELNVDGKETINVLIHDLQYDPVTDKFIHVDFQFVDLEKEVTADVPLVATGESKAVRELGGILQTKDMITVKCMAKIIPHQIEFDISPLEDFHSTIHIKDLKLPEGVEAVDDPELTVASVAAPRAEEEVAEAEEATEETAEAKKEEKTESNEQAKAEGEKSES